VFSGIVAAIGKVEAATPTADGVRLSVNAGALDLGDLAVGDSVAVNGVCLTVVARSAAGFDADVSRETLGCTAGFPPGASVNLEKALRLSDRLGGHLVSGHVDGIASVARIRAQGGTRLLFFTVPRELAKYVARKGSIAVNGVSLTVNEVDGARFGVNLIPHTLAASNLGNLSTGDRVNVEVDLIARHLERLTESRNVASARSRPHSRRKK